jgi:hypothetical protein
MVTLALFMAGMFVGATLGVFSFLLLEAAACVFTLLSAGNVGIVHAGIHAAETGVTITAGFTFGLFALWLAQKLEFELSSRWSLRKARQRSLMHGHHQ